jgi:hypothetical protein
MCVINVVLRNFFIAKFVCIFLVLAIDYFFGTLTLIPSGHQASTFFFHDIELPNIIIDFIIV